ncbi:MAG TPA: PEGA domain-containing protein [Candidatus Omnitrophota bacterium]|nr:PEGA domain-containing protein [Candidatus Omnitrophota bacterium]
MVQKVRAILFYISVILFFVLIPSVLLYSFGYKLDISKLRIIKTGLIYVESVPVGAKVYLNGRRIKYTTPAAIEELLPGVYKLSLALEGYYPWYQEVLVEPGKANILQDIILFSTKPHLEKINISDVYDFYVFPADKDNAYYISDNKSTIAKTSLNPKDRELNILFGNLELPENIKDLSLSPDKKKIFYYFGNRLEVLYVPSEKPERNQIKDINFSINTERKILNAFWYSDSEHVLIMTDKDIKIYELISQGKNNIVTLLNINDKRSKAFYDIDDDILYFTDIQDGPDGKSHKGLYRLDISKKSLFTFFKDIEGNIK